MLKFLGPNFPNNCTMNIFNMNGRTKVNIMVENTILCNISPILGQNHHLSAQYLAADARFDLIWALTFLILVLET